MRLASLLVQDCVARRTFWAALNVDMDNYDDMDSLYGAFGVE